MGLALEELAELGVGRVKDLGKAVEARGGGEGEVFDGLLDAGLGWTEESSEPGGAAGGVLVDVGVPAGDQRDVELPGEVGAKDAELAGAGDVDDLGLEGADGL